MKPIEFSEANVLLKKPSTMTDAECGSLHVYTDGENCISCWKLGWKERVSALLFGKVWLCVLSGSRTQPPVYLVATRQWLKKVEKPVQPDLKVLQGGAA